MYNITAGDFYFAKIKLETIKLCETDNERMPIYMNSTGALYQWDGRGTPAMFCILEGSANMMLASDMEGRQFTSEPPMQLWGAAERDRQKGRQLARCAIATKARASAKNDTSWGPYKCTWAS
jgi:hypothetical protein